LTALAPPPPPAIDILGIPVHAVTMAGTLDLIDRFIAEPRLHQVATVNPEFVMAAQSDDDFRRVLMAADLCLPDGVGLLFVCLPPSPTLYSPLMRLSKSFGKTLREAPAEAELASHKLLIRANYIRSAGAGHLYLHAPRLSRHSQDLEHPGRGDGRHRRPGDVDAQSAPGRPLAGHRPLGRIDVLFKLKGGGSREYALSATHEEIVVDLALREIESYRDLPRMVYHISKKFRDEAARAAACCACANSS
jgi:hypothetical protein